VTISIRAKFNVFGHQLEEVELVPILGVGFVILWTYLVGVGVVEVIHETVRSLSREVSA